MPSCFLCDVAWIIQGCVLILHMILVAMTTFMNQLAVAETHNHVWFMMQSGALSFWRRPEKFALHLVHRILNVTYTLDVNLCVLVHPEVNKQPQPSPLPLSIHSHPIPCFSPSHHLLRSPVSFLPFSCIPMLLFCTSTSRVFDPYQSQFFLLRFFPIPLELIALFPKNVLSRTFSCITLYF